MDLTNQGYQLSIGNLFSHHCVININLNIFQIVMKKYFFSTVMAVLLGFCLYAPSTSAQVDIGDIIGQSDTSSACINTVFTSIPFLRINPDGRTGGMGDVGIATEADPSAIFHNASKLAFADKKIGLGLTYTPWLRNLVPDIYIANLAGYTKIDDLQAMGMSIRYFSLGSINFRDITGQNAGEYRPNELAFDLAYARKLSEYLGIGVTLKYVRSDLARGQRANASTIVKAAQAVAGDISLYYENPDLTLFGSDATLSLGAAFTNIGNKVSYTENKDRDFIPVNLGVGAALTMEFDDYNKLMVTSDINKLLVPTPDASIDPESPEYPRNKNLLAGIFGSFSDAPGGFSEEMQELMYSFGLEYWYNEQFSVRAGHFNEHRCKGNRKFITLGLGLRYSVFGLNFSYIVPTSTQRHPLDNTLRFSLTFDFDDATEF